MKENISKNIIFTLFVTIITTFLSFLINRYLLFNLGDKELGLFRLLSQLVFYLSLLDLGISTSATVAYYKPLIKKDYNEISKIYHTIDIFYRKVSIITFILGVLAIPFLFYLVEFKSYLLLSIYWMIFVCNAVITFLLNKYIILYLADQKVFFIKSVTGIALIIEKAVQIILIIKFQSFLFFLFASFISNIIKFVFFKKRIDKHYEIRKNNKEYDDKIRSDASQMFFHKLSHIIQYNTDNILIAKFISLAAVASYSSYMMLTSLVITVVSIFHSVVDPVVGHLISVQSNKENYDLWIIFAKFSFWISGFVSLGFYYFATPFIINWLDDKMVLEQMVVILILVNLFFDLIKWPTELIKYKYAYYKDIYNPIIEVCINLAVSISLVGIYGISGVVVGTVIVNIIFNLIIKPIIIFKYCLKIPFIQYVKKVSFMIFEMFIIIGISHFVFSYFFSDNDSFSDSWGELILLIIAFFIIYTSLFLFVISLTNSKNYLLKLRDFIIKRKV